MELKSTLDLMDTTADYSWKYVLLTYLICEINIKLT